MTYLDQNSQPEEQPRVEDRATKITRRSVLNEMNQKKAGYNPSGAIKIIAVGAWVIFSVSLMTNISTDAAIYDFVLMMIFGLTGLVMGWKKDNALNGFLLGIAFMAFGLIMAAYLKDRTRTACRSCAEDIKTEAVICPFCKAPTADAKVGG